MRTTKHTLRLKRLGINTYKEAIVYIRADSHICRSEGFETQARIMLQHGKFSLIATLNTIDSDLLATDEASLSNYAWDFLNAINGDNIVLSHPQPPKSLGFIRSKVYGNTLNKLEIADVINDVVAGNLSDIHLSAFLTACSGDHLNKDEITSLTSAMLKSGQQLTWPAQLVVDKHCVGGLPANRTSLIVVPIITAFGLTMPKTSSRAITSPSGTADTMEVLAPVNLDLKAIRKVVEQENGCIVWGGAVNLSPADEILIRIERALDIDTEGQLIASILSKKIAAGSNLIVIDIPIGLTAKVRTPQRAELLRDYLTHVGAALGVQVRTVFTDGSQPVGRGIGPVLEAKDVLAVLQNDKNAPQDLRDRALTLAGHLLEFSKSLLPGTGKEQAQTILDSGQAWTKFQAICAAQGGMREPVTAKYSHHVIAHCTGKVVAIDNRRLARAAKLAGAPNSKAAGIELLTPLNYMVSKGEVLYTIYSQTRGELDYAMAFLEHEQNIIQIEEY